MLLLAATVPQTFLDFVDFDNVEKYWSGILQDAPLMEFVWCSLMISLGLWYLGGRLHLKCHLHHVTSVVITINMSYRCWGRPCSPTWLRQYLSGFSTVKLYSFPLSIAYSAKGSRYGEPTLRSGEWKYYLKNDALREIHSFKYFYFRRVDHQN